MKELCCDLKVHINGENTFFINQKLLCSYSGMFGRLVKQELKKKKTTKTQFKDSGLKITDFPGGAKAFELALKFCYGGGRMNISPANVALLHSAAIFLEMNENVSACNLFTQAETFMDGLFYWTWEEIIIALRSCELVLTVVDISGLLNKLISTLLEKISANSDVQLNSATPFPSSSSSSSSQDTFGFRGSNSIRTPEITKHCFAREWWFDDLASLSPTIIEKTLKALGNYADDNKNLVLTRFLLHYLKTTAQRQGSLKYKVKFSGLADTAVHGVVLMGRVAFSCRGLFLVLRIVSGFGLSKECRHELERIIGLELDRATLDDLLISGRTDGGVFDVSLVLRLVRFFVESEENGEKSLQRLKKVGKLVDTYLGEISPDQGLKVSKFLAVAESLPDSARDCFDGVYRALDIYIESHRSLSSEERMRLCRCLNYEKLTLEASKDLAKNPRIPPSVAMQALVSQQSKIQERTGVLDGTDLAGTPRKNSKTLENERLAIPKPLDEKEELRLNLQRMQNRVMELEKVCRQLKGRMSKITKNNPISSPSHTSSKGLPRLC